MALTPLDGETLWVLAVITLGIGFGAFIKGATGAGMQIIGVPVVSTFLGVEHAVVVMVVPGLATNLGLVWLHRRHLRATRDLAPLLAMGALGAIIGTFGLRTLDAPVLNLLVAGLIGLYVVMMLRGAGWRLPERVTRYTSPPAGLAAGLLQGATGIPGPIVAAYLHSFRLDKQAFVVSVAMMFLVLAGAQAVTLVQFGMFTSERATQGLFALVPTMLLLMAGARLTERLSRRTFDRWVLAVLLASAAKLLWDGVGGLT